MLLQHHCLELPLELPPPKTAIVLTPERREPGKTNPPSRTPPEQGSPWARPRPPGGPLPLPALPKRPLHLPLRPLSAHLPPGKSMTDTARIRRGMLPRKLRSRAWSSPHPLHPGLRSCWRRARRRCQPHQRTISDSNRSRRRRRRRRHLRMSSRPSLGSDRIPSAPCPLYRPLSRLKFAHRSTYLAAAAPCATRSCLSWTGLSPEGRRRPSMNGTDAALQHTIRQRIPCLRITFTDSRAARGSRGSTQDPQVTASHHPTTSQTRRRYLSLQTRGPVARQLS